VWSCPILRVGDQARISPATYAVRDDGSGGRNTGRSSRTRAESTVIPRVQPIRSAITVAGMVGVCASSCRIRGSTPTTTDPVAARTSIGGSAAVQVTEIRLQRAGRRPVNCQASQISHWLGSAA